MRQQNSRKTNMTMGKTTMNEVDLLLKKWDFPAGHVSFQVYIFQLVIYWWCIRWLKMSWKYQTTSQPPSRDFFWDVHRCLCLSKSCDAEPVFVVEGMVVYRCCGEEVWTLLIRYPENERNPALTKHFRYPKWRNPRTYIRLYGYGFCKGVSN